ncbi:MAG: chromophore lyase CpcT/CpeT [Gammaproteobacteria bacterium]
MYLKFHASLAMGVVACVALAGCSTQLKKAESELGDLAELLPGHYTNAAQVEADAKAGHETHPAVTLDIARISIPLLSDYVFYAQETSADYSRRITSQRLLTFQAKKDGTIVESLYTFAQPERWRDGHLNSGLFTGMMFTDTRPMGGCDIAWKKEGEKFVGANVRETCRVTRETFGSVRLEIRTELGADELSTAELAYSPGGKLVQGDAIEPYYRYLRGGGP